MRISIEPTKDGRDLKPYMDWFRELEDQNKSLEDLSSAEIADYQNRVFNNLLQYVSGYSPFYKKRLMNVGYDGQNVGLDFLQSIPFLTKEDLRDDFTSVQCSPHLAQLYCSTGTTGGTPIYMGHTLNELLQYYTTPKHPKLMNYLKNKTVANCLPYEMSSSAMSFHVEFQTMMDCTVLPLGKGGSYSQPAKAIEFIKKIKPEIMITTPSYAIVLYEEAQRQGEMGTEDRIKFEHIILTGEGASHSLRQKIERIWSTKATIFYGSLETMLMGIECKEQQGFHIPQGHIHMEIIDPATGRVLEPGQIGEITVTTLLREGMPLIRYRTGDLGYIDLCECTCGVKLPKIHMRGRISDQLHIGGRSYSPLYLENIIMSVEGTGNNYRLIVTKNGLVIEVTKEYQEYQDTLLALRIQSKLEYYTGTTCEVKILPEIQKASGKAKRVWYE